MGPLGRGSGPGGYLSTHPNQGRRLPGGRARIPPSPALGVRSAFLLPPSASQQMNCSPSAKSSEAHYILYPCERLSLKPQKDLRGSRAYWAPQPRGRSSVGNPDVPRESPSGGTLFFFFFFLAPQPNLGSGFCVSASQRAQYRTCVLTFR